MITKPDRSDPNFWAKLEEWKDDGPWTPASGGTEKPFLTRSGVRLLYCYQERTGKKAYLDCGTDIFLTIEEASNLMGLK